MPDPKENAKQTGDTHPPEVESDLPLQRGLRPDEQTPSASSEQPRRKSRGHKSKQPGTGESGNRAGWSPDDPLPKDETRLG